MALTLGKFMAGPIGRGLRILVGVIVLAYALFGGVTGVGQIVLLALGVFFVVVGAFNICVIAALLGAPLSGKKVLEM